MKVELLTGAVALLMLAGQAAAQSPASTCGRVSQFDMAPRHRQVYPVLVLAIDGRAPGPTTSNTFRVPPGPHVVSMAERIDHREFSNVELRRRTINRTGGRAKITFDVEPGYTYFVGAQSFLRSDRDAMAAKPENQYWAPVVYMRISDPCR